MTLSRELPCGRVNFSGIRTESVFPLKSRNYKVSATVGVTTVVAKPVRAILDTGAGPNLVREDILPENWERYRVPDEPAFNIVGAGGRRLRQRGTITLFLELGGLRVKAQFLVVAGLAAECILGCQFIDRHVRNILPKEKKITLSNDSVVSILRDSDPSQPSALERKRKQSYPRRRSACQS
jgi:hypothetical protein